MVTPERWSTPGPSPLPLICQRIEPQLRADGLSRSSSSQAPALWARPERSPVLVRTGAIISNNIKFICNASKAEICQMDKDDWKVPEEQHFLRNEHVTERIKNEQNCSRGFGKQLLRVPTGIPFRSKRALKLSQPTGKIWPGNAGLRVFALAWPGLAPIDRKWYNKELLDQTKGQNTSEMQFVDGKSRSKYVKSKFEEVDFPPKKSTLTSIRDL